MRYKEFSGTTALKEEYEAELLFQNVEMMFVEKDIRNNIINVEEQCFQYAIGLDVAVTSTKKSDETGIVLTGKKNDGTCIVLEDRTGTLTPTSMAESVLDLWVKYKGLPYILIEKNQGGDFIKAALLSCCDKKNISSSSLLSKIKEFHSTDSKSSRAYEPSISVKNNKVKFYNINNRLEKLISQLSRFTGFDNRHAADDRVDAFTSTINYLLHKNQNFASPGNISF